MCCKHEMMVSVKNLRLVAVFFFIMGFCSGFFVNFLR